MGLLSRAARLAESYRPRNASGIISATERFPFGFIPNTRAAELSGKPKLRMDQFLSLDEAAPWEGYGATSQTRMVPLDDLVATQASVHEGFLNRANKKPLTVVVGEDGRLLIIDGHHRAARARATGQDEVLARIWAGGTDAPA